MPFTGDDHNLPAGTIIPNGTASDAVTQHNAPFTDVSDALSELAVRVTGKQAASANLDEYAAVNPTAAGLALLDDADASAQRATLGLAIGTNVQAWSANLDEYSAVNPTAAGLALLDDASADAQLTTLGGGTAGIEAFKYDFNTVALLLADTALTYITIDAGDYINVRDGGYVYKVAASGATDHDLTTGAGGVVKLYVMPDQDGFTPAPALGIDTTGATNVAAALAAAIVAHPKIRLGAGNTYQIGSVVSASVTGDVVIDATGAILNYTGGGAITLTNTARLTTTMSAAATGALQITLGTTGAQIGDLVHIQSTTSVEADWGNYYVNMVHKITDVAGTLVTLDSPLRFPIGASEPGLVVTVAPHRTATIIGGTLTGLNGSTASITLKWFSGVVSTSSRMIGPDAFNLSSDLQPRGFTLLACYGVTFTAPHLERIAYGISPAWGTRATVVIGLTAQNCRHPVDPSTWSDGTTVIGMEAVGCYQSINSHPAFGVRYIGCNGVDELDMPNMRCIDGEIADCRVTIRPGVTPPAGRSLMAKVTLNAGFAYLWPLAQLDVDGLSITQSGVPFGIVDFSFGNVRISNLRAGYVWTQNTITGFHIGAGIDAVLRKYGEFSGGSTQLGIRSAVQIDAQNRRDAYLDGSDYVIDLHKNMVDQSGKTVRAFGTVWGEEALTARRIKVITNAFGTLDTPAYASGRVRLRGFVWHSSGSGYDVVTHEWTFNHKIVSTSAVTMATTPVLTRNGVATNSLSLVLSAVQQQGRTELPAADKFNVSFLITPTTTGASPRVAVEYELEMVARA